MIWYRSKNRLPSSKMCFRPWIEVFSQKCCKSRWFLSDDLLFILALRRGMMNSLQKTPKQLWHWFKRGRIILFFVSSLLACVSIGAQQYIHPENDARVKRVQLSLSIHLDARKKNEFSISDGLRKLSLRLRIEFPFKLIIWLNECLLIICLELFFDYGILSPKIRLID
jgi:hypothetical protein